MDFIKNQVAEFNTSQDSLKQIATMEWNIDEMFRIIYAGGIDSSDNNSIRNVYHYVVYIYADRLWALAWTIAKKEMTNYENELKRLYDDWITNHANEVPKTLLIKLREYKRWLYELKQEKLKLGVPTRTETTAQDRMKKAAGI
jgi:hypothetical protein